MISIKNLNVKYNNQGTLININCDIPDNAFISIFGPNGAGKTTLLKVILGLVTNYSGQVSIFDRSPTKVPSSWIGYVPQIKTLDFSFPATVYELLITGIHSRWPFSVKKKDQILALEILEKVGIPELGNQQLSELSGGQLQRVFLARAIIGNPKIIILDEPTTGVDSIGERDFYLILEKYQKENKASVLMVTHDWYVTYHHSTYVLLLNRYLIGFGTPQKTLTEECVRKAFGHEGHAHAMYAGMGGCNA